MNNAERAKKVARLAEVESEMQVVTQKMQQLEKMMELSSHPNTIAPEVGDGPLGKRLLEMQVDLDQLTWYGAPLALVWNSTERTWKVMIVLDGEDIGAAGVTLYDALKMLMKRLG